MTKTYLERCIKCGTLVEHVYVINSRNYCYNCAKQMGYEFTPSIDYIFTCQNTTLPHTILTTVPCT